MKALYLLAFSHFFIVYSDHVLQTRGQRFLTQKKASRLLIVTCQRPLPGIARATTADKLHHLFNLFLIAQLNKANLFFKPIKNLCFLLTILGKGIYS